LNNAPGNFVRVRPGKQLKREPPPTLPNYMMDTMNLLIQGLEKLSGITEVTEGRRPGQVTSGVAIEQLATMAQTTIRIKARQIENLLSRVGQKLLPRIFQYLTTDRVFSFAGAKGIEQYLFKREEIRKIGLSAFRDYQFKVVPTSSLAMTQWQKGLIATQLFQLGLIDEEAALDDLRYPNRQEVLERKRKAAQSIIGGNVPGFEQKRAPQKIPANMLRGPNRQQALQEPQVK